MSAQSSLRAPEPSLSHATGSTGPNAMKVGMPALAGVSGRQRLFDLLETAVRPVTWIQGPPGAGKTALLASYLERRGQRSLWYRMDASDGDPASFFHYLCDAVRAHTGDPCADLGPLTPAQLPRLAGFTRNFFDAVFERLDSSVALVFDDYQELPEDTPLQRQLAQVFAHLPPGAQVYVLSRTAPRGSWVPLQVQQVMRVISGEALQMTLDEARALAMLRTGRELALDCLVQMQEQVQGWAAGWVLILESGGLRLSLDPVADARNAFFHYFAGVLLSEAPPATRLVLMQASLLPQMATSLLQQLTGNPEAGEILANLHRRNFFTARLAGPDEVYQFHPLFREFLRSRAGQMVDRPARINLQRTAVRLLCDIQQYDDAARLTVECEDWNGLSHLIRSQAAQMTEQGRTRTLQGWIASLPPPALTQDPWVLLWLAGCRAPSNSKKALVLYRRAYRQFKHCGDPEGLYLAWTGAVDMILNSFRDFSGLEDWRQELRELELQYPLEEGSELAARVATVAAYVGGATGDRGGTACWVERIEQFVAFDRESPKVGHYLAILPRVYGGMGWIPQLDSALERLSDFLQLHPDAPALLRLHGCATFVWVSVNLQNPRYGEEWVQLGRDLIAQTGLGVAEPMFAAYDVLARQFENDDAGVEAALSVLARDYVPSMPRMKALHGLFSLHHHWIKGEIECARDEGRRALAVTESHRVRFAAAHVRIGMALLEAECRADETARQLLDEAQAYADSQGNAVMQLSIDAARAFLALRAGHWNEAETLVRHLFGEGRNRGEPILGTSNPRVVVPICEFALRRAIEVDYCRYLIKLHHLRAPSSESILDDWPWAIRIHVIGAFRLQVHDESAILSAKTQKKPLELLQALCAAPGRTASLRNLAAMLWPDQSDTAAMNAMRVTVHRTRKLLGHDEALKVCEGQLSFASELVWSDIAALEACIRDIEDLCTTDSAMDDEALHNASCRLLSLCRGSSLREADQPVWLAAALERGRVRSRAAMERIASYCEERSCWSEAISIAERGLEADPLAEEFYRILMRCHAASGRLADGMRAYRRCREIRWTALGRQPSPLTQALVRDLQMSEAPIGLRTSAAGHVH